MGNPPRKDAPAAKSAREQSRFGPNNRFAFRAMGAVVRIDPQSSCAAFLTAGKPCPIFESAEGVRSTELNNSCLSERKEPPNFPLHDSALCGGPAQLVQFQSAAGCTS